MKSFKSLSKRSNLCFKSTRALKSTMRPAVSGNFNRNLLVDGLQFLESNFQLRLKFAKHAKKNIVIAMGDENKYIQVDWNMRNVNRPHAH